MGGPNLPTSPARVTPATVAGWLGAEVTICELEATEAMARGDETGALGMLARAGGLADAYALITGACRTCGAHVGDSHRADTCRSGGLSVGGIGDVDATYCSDVAPPMAAWTHENFGDESGRWTHTVWTPGGQA